MPFLTFRRDHLLAVQIGDHLRFGIICGPIWGSLPVWESFAVGDHLRRCTGPYSYHKHCSKKIAWLLSHEQHAISSPVWLRILRHLLYEYRSCYALVKSKLKHPPRVYPGHLTSFATREEGNLIHLVSPGAGHLITTHTGWWIWSLASISCSTWRDKSWRRQSFMHS